MQTTVIMVKDSMSFIPSVSSVTAIAAVICLFSAAAAPAQVVPPASAALSEGLVTISFDDAWRSQFTKALPVLEASGIKATFYITAEPLQKGWDDFMTAEETKAVSAKGHEIGSHTVTHPHLPKTVTAAAERELAESKAYLERLTGTPVITFAYPYGETDARMKPLVEKAGYTCARSIEADNLNGRTADRYFLSAFVPEPATPMRQIRTMIAEAKVKRQWLILVFHKVEKNGGKYSVSPAAFQRIVNEVKASGVKTVTIGEGVAALGARQTADAQ
jgi:peptidoglycan/xylan/chitin deacetylase (PgdA/CDA1 family)